MGTTYHKNLTGTDLHEPKGIANAAANTVYVAGGTGSGTWTADLTVNTITYADTVWDDMTVEPTRSYAPGTSGWANLEPVMNAVYALHFDYASIENCVFSVQIPHKYKEGTNLHPHLHWCQKSTNAGNVVWGLEWTKFSNGSNTAFTTVTQEAAAAAPNVAYRELKTEFTEIDGSTFEVSDVLLCRLFRNANAATDTLNADDAVMLSFDFHYEIDKLGTNVENG